MQAVCHGKEWDVALCEEPDGTITGAMPYLIGRKLGMRYVLQPQLTQYCGPWYRLAEGLSECDRLNEEERIAEVLMQQIEALGLAYYQQNFAPQITNWLPYSWMGFSQTTRYTYRIAPIADSEQVYAGFHHRRKHEIRRCEGGVEATTEVSALEFAQMHQRCYTANGGHDLLPESLIVRVIEAAMERRQGALLGLKDAQGGLLAALFAPFDDHWAYALMMAVEPDAEQKGLRAMLMWQMMRLLRDRSQGFDFEGSMHKGVEHYYRFFGANQVPYMSIEKCNNRLFGLLLRIKR